MRGTSSLAWNSSRTWTALALAALATAAFSGVLASSASADYRTSILRGETDRTAGVGWTTAILRGRGSRFERQFCGGSLVSRRYVLTAAHCTDGVRANKLQVLVGTKNLGRGGQVLNVTRNHVYPRWNPRTFYGDMALLRLRGKARTKPVSLVPTGTHYVGQRGWIAGWGNKASVRSGRRDFPTRLQSAYIPIQPDSRCIEGPPDPTYDGSVMLCAGFESGAPDTCQGDSGGPLARKVDGRWRLVGVTSYGLPGCGSSGTYGVYAWVGSQILGNWLRNRVG